MIMGQIFIRTYSFINFQEFGQNAVKLLEDRSAKLFKKYKKQKFKNKIKKTLPVLVL